SVAASESDPDAPPPAPTRTGAAPLRPDDAPLRSDDAPLRPDDAPLRPDDAPPSDAVAGATAGSFAVYLPLVVRPEPYPPVNRAWELEFIRLLNEERARHGLHPLREHPLLTLAARRHAYDVGINQMSKGPEHCSHQGTDGTEPGQRVAWAGYPGHWTGEAISCGKHEVYYAVQGLLNSPPHRAFLLRPIPVEIGVGAHPVLDELGGYTTVMLGGTPNP
ncbi:MAG: CAP domain-containing protein, partial [Roseiflexus sp.]|uniref:CAP domain-containing protein n=1 Tax=Roseiflexus sp. TaxID=2562120 RepID=UPI0025F093DA